MWPVSATLASLAPQHSKMKVAAVLVLAVLGAVLGAKERSWSPSKPRAARPREEATPKDQEDGMEAIERDGVEFLRQLDRLSSENDNKVVLAEWAYDSNITDHNLKNKLAVSAENAKFQKEQWAKLTKFPWRQFKDADTRRQFKLASVLGTAALPEADFAKYEETVSEMQTIYSKAKICDFKDPTKCDLSLEPELTELLMKSRDPEELRHVWVEWRRATGEKVRGLYKQYVALSNKAAELNNFPNAAGLWLRSYEADDFRDQVSQLWDQLMPLYQQLHAYVRRNLRNKYGESVVSAKGPIPAHLLGNMWSQTWGNVGDFMMPYPKRQSTDVTPNMVKQGYTPLKMFQLSEQFFTSLNLSAMPAEFWEKSILEKPSDGRDLVCHASAWDFYDAKDFRIKQCTRVNQEDLYTAHHEMGHIQYFLQYKHQPVVYRTGANPGKLSIKQCTRVNQEDLYTAHHEMGHVQYYLQYKHLPVIYRRGANSGFHEAVGDVMSLSVSTPKHLKAIGLLDESSSSDKDAEREATINHLFSVALDKISFLPFSYMLDLWRWDVFEGRTHSEEYNCHWWKLREQYQGIEPPVDRTEEDFDPAAKYHVVASVPYIRYFVSFVIQFQFHKALCEKAGQLENGAPLHECDIYKSTNAGNLLGDMLQMGASKPWPEAMQLVTGQPRMDATPLREYFAPLEEWLREQNKNEFVGWEPSSKICVQSREELRRLTKSKTNVQSPDNSNKETVHEVKTPAVEPKTQAVDPKSTVVEPKTSVHDASVPTPHVHSDSKVPTTPHVHSDAKATEPHVHSDAKVPAPHVHSDAKVAEPHVHSDAKVPAPHVHSDDKATEPHVHSDAKATETHVHSDAKVPAPHVHTDAKVLDNAHKEPFIVTPVPASDHHHEAKVKTASSATSAHSRR